MNAIVIGLFLLCVFTLYLGPITDGDFFWHLKTGEWIWQHRALPTADPFADPRFADAACQLRPEAAQFLLRGYWLAQVILFLIWKWAGPAGIILLRAAIYTGIVALLLLWSKKRNSLLIAFIMSLLLATLLKEFPGERPQLFTFLLTPITLYLLEKIRTDAGKSILQPKDRVLPFVMLVWSNLHGGFTMGVALIAIYMAGEVIKAVRSKAHLPLRIIMVGLMAILSSLVNPSFHHVFILSIKSFSPATAGIQEYLSPFTVAARLGEFYWPYFIFLVGACGIVVWRFRSMEPAHIMALFFLGGLSVSGLRFMPYFLMTGPILIGYLPRRELRREWGIILLVTVVWALSFGGGYFRNTLIEESFPARAVEFIRDNRPAGRMFNYYSWGGYLIHSLPEYPSFIDGRGLNTCADDAYEAALWRDGWKKVFRDNSVHTVLMPGLSLVSGEVYPLITNLMADSEWFLVYRDEWSLVFVMNDPRNRELIGRYAMNKEFVFDHVMAASTRLIKDNPNNPAFWRSRAFAHYHRGELQDALADYRMVLKLDPGDRRALEALNNIGQMR